MRFPALKLDQTLKGRTETSQKLFLGSCVSKATNYRELKKPFRHPSPLFLFFLTDIFELLTKPECLTRGKQHLYKKMDQGYVRQC